MLKKASPRFQRPACSADRSPGVTNGSTTNEAHASAGNQERLRRKSRDISGTMEESREEEQPARQSLADEAERIRDDLLGAARTQLCIALEPLEAELSRVAGELSRVEENVVRIGFSGTEVRIDDVAETVREEVSRASLCTMEKHLDHLATSVREELRRQEERVMGNTIHALETRLDELTVCLRDELCRQEERLASGVGTSSTKGTEPPLASADNSNNNGRDSMESMNVRMTELAGLLREESRRQDNFEVRLAEIASTFHEELKRQEEVLIAELSKFGNELERLAGVLSEELRRHEEEVVQVRLMEQEKLINEVRDEQSNHQGILSDLSSVLREDAPYKGAVQSLRGELQAEITGQSTKIDSLGEMITELRASMAEREKDFWHALDTHTHDVAFDHEKAAAAAAAAATAATVAASSPQVRSASASARRLNTSQASRTSMTSAGSAGAGAILTSSGNSVPRFSAISISQPIPVAQTVVTVAGPSRGSSPVRTTISPPRRQDSSVGRYAAATVSAPTGAFTPRHVPVAATATGTMTPRAGTMTDLQVLGSSSGLPMSFVKARGRAVTPI